MFVLMSGWSDGDGAADGVLGVGGAMVAPASFVLESVSAAAFAVEVVVAGGSVRKSLDVIEIAFTCGQAAVTASNVAGADMVGQWFRWSVPGPAVVEQSSAQRVGDQAAPNRVGVEGNSSGHLGGDWTVPRQVAGFVGHAA
jgi:hypothetical protein